MGIGDERQIYLGNEFDFTVSLVTMDSTAVTMDDTTHTMDAF